MILPFSKKQQSVLPNGWIQLKHNFVSFRAKHWCKNLHVLHKHHKPLLFILVCELDLSCESKSQLHHGWSQFCNGPAVSHCHWVFSERWSLLVTARCLELFLPKLSFWQGCAMWSGTIENCQKHRIKELLWWSDFITILLQTKLSKSHALSVKLALSVAHLFDILTLRPILSCSRSPLSDNFDWCLPKLARRMAMNFFLCVSWVSESWEFCPLF